MLASVLRASYSETRSDTGASAWLNDTVCLRLGRKVSMETPYNQRIRSRQENVQPFICLSRYHRVRIDEILEEIRKSVKDDRSLSSIPIQGDA